MRTERKNGKEKRERMKDTRKEGKKNSRKKEAIKRMKKRGNENRYKMNRQWNVERKYGRTE